ncbi:MAG: bis(5'-nucleosyl)-tetraphosphatase (symmetrical) YqeK [Butyrivibrio sp.]|nr:bis(5'-nucleosyl)-tetraphosphatase (symmetrical) YqeK [Butyrivibrio sp.]
MSKYDLDKITRKLSEKIDAARLRHTIGVQYTAASLAMALAPQGREKTLLEQAMVAGLLHDNAKYMSGEKLLEKALKHGIEASETERENPVLLHGKLGAYYAKHRYGVEDKEILSAIAFHTTGRPDMTLLEKIIFTADYIEPGRKKQPRLDELRRLAFEDIDLCVYYISEDTLTYLSQGAVVDKMTERTRDFYAPRSVYRE